MAPEDPQFPVPPDFMHLLIPVDLARLLHDELAWELQRIEKVKAIAAETRDKATALADPSSNASDEDKKQANDAAASAAFAAERAEYAVLVMKPETTSKLLDLMATGLLGVAAISSRGIVVLADDEPQL